MKFITEVKNAMENDRVRRKLEDDENKSRGAQNSQSLGAVNSRESGNTSFVKDQRAQAQAMIGQQDVQLGGLETAVDRLHVAGEAIGEELKVQNKMLNELEDDLDDAGNKMTFVQAKLSKLLKTKDGCQIWTIVGLAVILAILSKYLCTCYY
jgi:chromosome segregation ATPase